MIRDRNPRNLTLVTHYVENNEDFIPPLRLKEGLRELFRDYPFPESKEVRRVSDITTHYEALSQRYGFQIDVPEMALVVQADEFSDKGASDAVIEILEYLVQVYPRSANGYWRLANLHREPGNREKAIGNEIGREHPSGWEVVGERIILFFSPSRFSYSTISSFCGRCIAPMSRDPATPERDSGSGDSLLPVEGKT